MRARTNEHWYGRPNAHRIAFIIAAHLGVDPRRVVPTARLACDLHATPLALVRATLALEDLFGVHISDAELTAFRTIEDIMVSVARSAKGS